MTFLYSPFYFRIALEILSNALLPLSKKGKRHIVPLTPIYID